MQVVARNNNYTGKVGVIKMIMNKDDDDIVYVAFGLGLLTYEFRRDDLKVVGAAAQKPAPHKLSMSPIDAQAEFRPGGHDPSGRLKVGAQVQVVARDDKYDGQVGVIKKITDEDHGYNVRVAFQDGSRRLCRRDALKVVGAGPQAAMSGELKTKCTPLQRIPDKDANSVQSKYPFRRYWQGLSNGLKLVAGVGAGILLVLILILIVLMSSRPWESAAYKQCVSEQRQEARNAGVDPDKLEDSIEKYCHTNND